jgi:outer membrane protein TolC
MRGHSPPTGSFIGLLKPIGLAAALLAGVVSAGPGVKAAGAVPDPNGPAGPPPTKAVEFLGSGWPQSTPIPQTNLAPLPDARLAKLSLAEAVQLSNQRNPVVRQSYNDLVATENSLGAAYAAWWPVINATLNTGWYGEKAAYNYQGALSGGPQTCYPGATYCATTNFTSSYFQSLAQFDINWNIYDPLRTATIWKSKYLVRQAADSYVIARRDNTLRTEEAYINLQSALAKVITSQQLVSNDQLLYRLTQTRMKLGVASKLELAKQLTVLNTDQVNLLNAQQAVQVAQAKLAELLSVANANAIGVAAPFVPLGSWEAELEPTLKAAMDYRKVIEQKLTEVQVNKAQAKIDLAVYRPTIALVNSLYWTYDYNYTGLTPPDVPGANSQFFNGSSALQITFTGFDGGAARMNAESALAKARAAEASVQGAVNQVRQEVQSYHAQSIWGRKAVIVASDRVKSATQALRLQSLRFNAGYGTITDVVQAQQDLTQGVQSYIEVLTSYNTALVDLARASGLVYRQDAPLEQAVGNPLERLSLPVGLARMR